MKALNAKQHEFNTFVAEIRDNLNRIHFKCKKHFGQDCRTLDETSGEKLSTRKFSPVA